MMKILFVNTYDARTAAMSNIHLFCRDLGGLKVDCEMLVQVKESDAPYVTDLGFESHRVISQKIQDMRHSLDNIPVKMYRHKNQTMFSPAWLPNKKLINRINQSDADLVHLNWVAHGMLRIEDLSKIKKPVIWSLHDMMPITGGCHYDNRCCRYETHCGNCPVLGSHTFHDLSYFCHERKIKTFAKMPNLVLNGIGKWITDCAKKSVTCKNNRISNVSSPIDTHAFRPLRKDIARDLLDLPCDKKIIAFGGDGMVSAPRKGYVKLKEALELLPLKDVEILVFGANPKSVECKYPVHFTGHVNTVTGLRVIYSAADVIVLPSLQEVLGWVAAEPMSCGTPAVTFDIDGPKYDIVDHLETGYRATPYDPKDLSNGIRWVLKNENYDRISRLARQRIIERFDSVKIAGEYKKLYEDILAGAF